MSTQTWFYHPIKVDRRELVPPPGGEFFEFQSLDGTRLGAWWVRTAKSPSRGAVLYLHGNYGNLKTQWFQASYLPEMGYDVLAVDWREFGASQGKATRKGLWLDAQAAVQELVRRAPDSRRFALGHSLGASYALGLAGDPSLRGVVSLAGFTSHRAIGAEALREGGCPAGLDRVLAWILIPRGFDPPARFFKQTAPLLIVHGDQDRKVPYRMAGEFHRTFEGSVCLPMPGYGHEGFHEGPLGTLYLNSLEKFLSESR